MVSHPSSLSGDSPDDAAAAADERPTITLRRDFITRLEEILAGHPMARAALLGVIEGAKVDGEYSIHIESAMLVPRVTTPAPASGEVPRG